MAEQLIKALVYTDVDDARGPQPIFWIPEDMNEETRLAVSIKVITMLTGEYGEIPKSLMVIPFPSFNLKGVVKFIEKEDAAKRGDVARSAITLLFDQINDVVFYKYLSNLNPLFNEIAQAIIETEDKEKTENLLKTLFDKISETLGELRAEECKINNLKAFPEIKEEKKADYVFKAIFCGDGEVGKTSLVLRYTDKAFRKTYLPTIGVNISNKSLNLEDSTVHFNIWDIAGQAKFERFRIQFYIGVNAVMIVFDLTNPESFKSVKNWYNDLITYTDDPALAFSGFIIGNKKDLEKERKVSVEEGKALAEELNLNYLETSALTGENVELVFEKLVGILIDLK